MLDRLDLGARLDALAQPPPSSGAPAIAPGAGAGPCSERGPPCCLLLPNVSRAAMCRCAKAPPPTPRPPVIHHGIHPIQSPLRPASPARPRTRSHAAAQAARKRRRRRAPRALSLGERRRWFCCEAAGGRCPFPAELSPHSSPAAGRKRPTVGRGVCDHRRPLPSWTLTRRRLPLRLPPRRRGGLTTVLRALPPLFSHPARGPLLVGEGADCLGLTPAGGHDRESPRRAPRSPPASPRPDHSGRANGATA